MNKKKIIIIGAGIGGLSAAVRLANKNHQVLVYESAGSVGGKTKNIEKDGFSWGYGASLLTMPHLIDELFISCNKNPNDYYAYHKLETLCKYFFCDKTIVETSSDRDKLEQELLSKLGEPIDNVRSHLRSIEQILKYTEHIFLQSSLHKFKTYFNRNTLHSILNIFDIGLLSTMDAKNTATFKNPNTVQLFDRYATYNGSDPFQTPATMNVIAAPEYLQGGYIMNKGMPQIAQVMYQLAAEQGVQFYFDAKVDEIVCEKDAVSGVIINKHFEPADIVVSNVDVDYTYSRLLPKAYKPTAVLKQERSTSAVIFYLGISKSFPQLKAHNIFFGDNYAKEFENIKQGKIYEDPTVYLFISSKEIESHAPKNMENWFLLVNVPHNSGQQWEHETARLRSIALKKVSSFLGIDVGQFIVAERINTPESIEQDTLSVAGSLYGPSSNSKMSAFMRHANFSTTIKNMYFAGGSVHPGGGVPLCILSGKIVADLID